MSLHEEHPETFLDVLLQDEGARQEFAAASLEVKVQALIADAMTRQRVSQAKLARRLGLSRSRINQVVSGDPKNLTLGMMGRIAEALGCRWDLGLKLGLEADAEEASQVETIAWSPSLPVGAWNLRGQTPIVVVKATGWSELAPTNMTFRREVSPCETRGAMAG